MIADIHSFQLPLVCELSKSTPNILWSLGSSLHNQFLQVGKGNPAVIVAKMSFNAVLERHARKTPRARTLSVTAVRREKAARV
jgi:hypothetical protein